MLIRSHQTMQNEPTPGGLDDRMEVRARLFTDLDRLAFALEMEAAEHLDQGRTGEYLRAQERRLGVRLAQRLVSGVRADEVEGRIWRWSGAYDRRLGVEGGEGA